VTYLDSGLIGIATWFAQYPQMWNRGADRFAAVHFIGNSKPWSPPANGPEPGSRPVPIELMAHFTRSCPNIDQACEAFEWCNQTRALDAASAGQPGRTARRYARNTGLPLAADG
jgi:hypothetical protein